MKKHRAFSGLLPLAFLLGLFALAGCSLTSATLVQFDSPLPPEQKCTLNIAANFSMKKFDGQPVDWSAGFGDLWAQVQIPEGSHTFVFDYQFSGDASSFSSYRGYGLSVTYDRFLAGHTYLLAAQPVAAGSNSLSIRVGVRDVTNDPDWGSFSRSFGSAWTQGFIWLPIDKTAD